mgnify:CR=1 FL=1
MDDGIFAVLQVAPEAVSTAAKGTKKYKILPMNSVETYIVEERWLKKATKRQTMLQKSLTSATKVHPYALKLT